MEPSLDSELADKYPKLLSSYSLIMEIGRGGQGTVFLAQRRSDQELFACKTVEDASEEIHFLQHMQGSSAVPFLHQVIYDETSCHLILELCDSNLRDRVKRVGPLCEKETAQLIKYLATCLLALHNEEIIHRDMKLDNILISAEAPPYSVKIGDLGMAANCTRGSTIQTEYASGTSRYLSPEATHGKYSEATDVWGLGLILYECLSGTLAFSKISSKRLLRHLNKGLEVTCKLDWSNVQEEAKEFILHMLQLDPSKRPSVADIIEHPWVVSRCEDRLTKKRKLEQHGHCSDVRRLNKKFRFQKRNGDWCLVKPSCTLAG